MNVTYKNYILEEDAGRFDLIELKDGKTKDGKVKEEKVPNTVGYAYTLESAINRIVSIEMSKEFDTLTLAEFLKEYRATKEEIKTYLDV